MGERWDAIVVGAGLSGLAAAVHLARARRRVIVVDPHPPGVEPGAGGGYLRARELDALLPGGSTRTGLAVAVVETRWRVLTGLASVSIDYRRADRLSGPDSTVLVERAGLRAQLVREAEAGGVEIRWNVRVDQLIHSKGVGGVRLPGEELHAGVTILATGSGDCLVPESRPVVHDPGLSERLALPGPTVTSRFSIGPGEGVALEAFLEGPAGGPHGRGFMYTHPEHLTVGVLLDGGHRPPSAEELRHRLEEFKRHPSIAPVLRGSSSEGTSSFRRPIGVYEAARIGGTGYLVVGEATGLSELGFPMTPRWDPALASARLAAQALGDGLSVGAISSRALPSYRRRLAAEGLFARSRRARRTTRRLQWDRRVYEAYPSMVQELFHEMMTESGGPKRPIHRSARSVFRSGRVRWRELAKDGLSGGGSW